MGASGATLRSKQTLGKETLPSQEIISHGICDKMFHAAEICLNSRDVNPPILFK